MTTRLPPEDYLKYWEAGEAQEFGIEIKINPEDQTKFVNALYESRRTFGGYENLMLFQPQPLGTIFITKQTVELPA